MNDPGTAIDVIGRGVRILSAYAQNKSDEIEVKYPSVHVAPLQNNDLLEDFFSPVARDGASMREIQIRVLKGLSMLSKGWPGIFAEAAQTLAFETLEHATRADHIDSDRYLIKSIYYNLFSGEDSNKTIVAEQAIRLLASQGQSIRVRVGVCFVPEADADHSVYRPTIRYILKLPDCSFHKTMGIQMQQSYKPGLIK